ncbi:hypothetical protein F5880DRAFT_1493322 [Lentinula raphanica]|nr:hypothetical protein EV360DRAFT_45834 [Lentinula raphanica]KAJ3817194.1 hypothetical protein F5880DRAFT_1493322 [Lentinula raphanica]
MTAAYAFTDYRAQGQTLSVVIIDMAKVPTGALTLTSLYVALSRKPDLETEDERLNELDERTRRWWSDMLHETVTE